jgi:hypothetical protein
MNLTNIEKQFANEALIRGGVFLLSATDALRFVDACEQKGEDILGVEGFKVFGEKIQPFQEHSFDLYGKKENTHAITKEFIRQRINSDIWFEVGISQGSC